MSNPRTRPALRSGIYANDSHSSQGFMLMRSGDRVVLALFGYRDDQTQFWATGAALITSADDDVSVPMFQISRAQGGECIADAILRAEADGSIQVVCDFASSIGGPAYRGTFKPVFFG